MPLAIFPIVTVIAFYLSAIGMGNQVHFLLNKSNLQAIDTLSQDANVYQISNMRRHHKILNDQLISNDDSYTTEREIAAAYAGKIRADDLDVEKVALLRKKLDRSGIVSMAREDGYIVLTMGGFLDNEFGYLKAPNNDIEVGYMIPPYALEVTFSKTVHVIFPAPIRYVDLGSADLLAAKADGAENVLRVKAALRDFSKESNLAVITEDGAYYTFNVKYADEPVKLSVEMTDFIHDGEAVNRPNNAMEIYMRELGSESPLLVKLIMKSIYKNNDREIKHIGSKRFSIQYTLKGIYTHNGLLYFHMQLKNSSNVPFDVDYITFKIVDKKVAKRTAIQEQVIMPLRAHNNLTYIGGKKTERCVFTLQKFTIPDDKQLVIELNEKEGGRHQSFIVENADLVRAKVINELKTK